ncbi:MAG TPA: murein L,D-transpeptidase family protein [Xanthobacteraceae bacterium]|nr:murein L,D-transpeptidase family protein [Xanthobacteraceae bacterium]
MSRAILTKLRAALAVAVFSLTLAGCFSQSMYSMNEKASRQLSPEMISLIEKKGMTKESPILVRIFKEESELEVWKQTSEGKYDLLKTYPICRWSGDLGPKIKTGDRQAPEGFYMITPGLMNPNSSYYLSFNTGFPNAFDRSLNRTGSNLMVHGDCSSAGCYAMTDEQIGEIFSLAREAFTGGQRAFQVQAYPFRMTPKNMARHRNNPNIAFWRMLKEGNDHFEVTRQEPKVDVCDRRYVFNAIPFDPMQPFHAQQKCPVFDQPIEVAEAVKAKREADHKEYAELVRRGTPTAPVHEFKDGGMNPVFASKFPDRNPNATRVALTPADTREADGVRSPAADAPTGTTVIPAMASASDEKPGVFDKIGSWLRRNPEKKIDPVPPPPTVASAPAPVPAAAPKTRTVSAPAPKPRHVTQTASAKPAPAAKPQKEAQQTTGTMQGSAPILSSSSFSAFR